MDDEVDRAGGGIGEDVLALGDFDADGMSAGVVERLLDMIGVEEVFEVADFGVGAVFGLRAGGV